LMGSLRKDDLLVFGVVSDVDLSAAGDLLVEHLFGHGVLDEPLDAPLERPRPEGGVEPLLEQETLGVLREFRVEPLELEFFDDARQHHVQDVLHLFAGERVEDDQFVDPVQEFGVEGFLDLFHHGGFHRRIILLDVLLDQEPERFPFRDHAGPHVGGHDDDGVLEVHLVAEVVGQHAVIHDLEQDVERVRVRLLDLVEQHHRIGFAAHGLGELSALFVTHVAGGRADEAAHGELLHEFRHVDADERLLVAEEEFRQRAGQFRLPHAGGS